MPLKLKELRENNNLKQIDIAKKLNISQVTISQYELGKTEPDIKTLIRIADYFNVTVDYLIDRTNNIEKDTIRREISKLSKEELLKLFNKQIDLLLSMEEGK